MLQFADYSDRLQHRLEAGYGIRVVTRDIAGALIGDLDGSEIHIDLAVSPEQRLFLLGHLFGHTAQWNTDDGAFELGQPKRPPVPADLLPALLDYERGASRYALDLFHQIGIIDADQWLSDYSACDIAYLFHFYRTGEKQDFRSFWRDNTEILQARSVPPFTLTRRAFRLEGIVI